MSHDHGFHFEPDGIGHILQDRRLVVPQHQRSYKWEKDEHVRGLFEDIADNVNEEDGYFLGMIVLMRGRLATDRLQIIDGQQRLATVSILLAAIRNYFQAIGDDRFHTIQSDFLASRDLRTRVFEPYLTLNVDDDMFFRENIVFTNETVADLSTKKRDQLPISHRRILEAMDLAKEQVAKIVAIGTAENAIDRLLNWVEFLKHRAKVVTFYVDADQNAFTIFETLNDRGLELTKVDLLKNYLFGKAGDKLDEVKQRWTEMTSVIEAAGDEEASVEYVRHYWMSMHSPVKKRNLFKEIKAKERSKAAVCELASGLSREAKHYAALLNPESELWKEYGDTTKDHVTALRRMQIEVIRPLALAVLRKFPQKEVKLTFHLFVNWSVRFLIVGGHRGEAIEKAYSEAALEVNKNHVRTAAQLSKHLADTIPKDETFKASFAAASVSKSVLARYYLRAIEDSSQNEAHPEKITDPKADKLTLEHILPENPSTEWSISVDEAASLQHRIGNLALLPMKINSEDARNCGFDAKSKIYLNSGLKFTKCIPTIGDGNTWGKKEIDIRSTMLAAEAVKTWPLKVW